MHLSFSLFAWSAWWIGAAVGVGGLIWFSIRWRARNESNRELVGRIRREDALKHLCKCEAEGSPATLASVAGILELKTTEAAALLAEMEQRGLVSFLGGDLRLTAAGHESGLHIIRAHRLWESHLAHETGVHASEWHAQAEKQEHSLTTEDAAALAARLGYPAHDPHGDVIPAVGGALPTEVGRPLNTLSPGQTARVVHIEDEPEVIRAQLVAEGLYLGTQVRLLEKNDQCVRFWSDGDEHSLAPIIAHHVDVVPLAAHDAQGEETTLAGLKTGERATVVGLAQSCRGAERQRLLDLGFVRGTDVVADMKSPTGDPTAYRVRGSVIALRREQARLVMVSPPRTAGESMP
jgi:DtxR family Mn-dependent transcriptional regulator